MDVVREDSMKDPATDPSVPLAKVLVDEVSLLSVLLCLNQEIFFFVYFFFNKTVEDLDIGSLQVDRKLVKQTVMTSVYGVTFIGARQQIMKRLQEKGHFTDDKLLYDLLNRARCAQRVLW